MTSWYSICISMETNCTQGFSPIATSECLGKLVICMPSEQAEPIAEGSNHNNICLKLGLKGIWYVCTTNTYGKREAGSMANSEQLGTYLPPRHGHRGLFDQHGHAMADQNFAKLMFT